MLFSLHFIYFFLYSLAEQKKQRFVFSLKRKLCGCIAYTTIHTAQLSMNPIFYSLLFRFCYWNENQWKRIDIGNYYRTYRQFEMNSKTWWWIEMNSTKENKTKVFQTRKKKSSLNLLFLFYICSSSIQLLIWRIWN